MPDLMVPSAGPRMSQEPLGFHQGYVLEWNALTGTNLIRILGSDQPNVLSLMGGEVGLIRAGDTVGVLRFQTQYFVLGRIEAAGVEQRALGVHFAEDINNAAPSNSAWASNASGPSVTVDIGSTRRCFVSLSAEMSITNTLVWAGFRVSGASTIEPVEWRSLAGGGAETYLEATRTVILTEEHGLEEGSNTFTMMYRIGSTGDPVPIVAERQLIVQPF